jgi:hypothetical protein
MAGHISYPRTAAAESAWADYRDAITLANAGSADLAISLLRDILADPNAPPHLKQIAAELLAKLLAELNAKLGASETMSAPAEATGEPPPSDAAPDYASTPAAPPEVVSQPSQMETAGGVRLSHILQPDFRTNRQGDVILTGLHHIEGPQDLTKGRVVDLLAAPNKYGIFEATVEAQNPADQSIRQKYSTMFPDHFTQAEVAACIDHAHRYGRTDARGHIVGPSGRGFDIKIVPGRTAYPIFNPADSDE